MWKREVKDDYLDNLGPVKKKFFLDILKSTDYNEFIRFQL